MPKKTVSKQKATGSHFTPPGLATMVARRLVSKLNSDEKYLSVLDPSCGDGGLLLAFANEFRRHNYELIGIETDKESIDNAKIRLASKNVDTRLIQGDFLKAVSSNQNMAFWEDIHENFDEKADIIIANPPYVRTQVLGANKAQKLAQKFNLSGRVDLYYAFLVAMTSALKTGGLIGVITSNRYLTTQSGTPIRKFLFQNYDIIEIIDLGDTKLFDAAVLPAVFIGRKKVATYTDTKQPHYFRIYEARDKEVSNDSERIVNSVYEILDMSEPGRYKAEGKSYDVSIGQLTIPENYRQPWVMATNNQLSLVQAVNDAAKFTIEDIAEVKVGIKTTADSVFIRSDWRQLDENVIPESELLRPLISSDETSRWFGARTISRKVLYTHEMVNGKRRAIDLTAYPRARAYLESHKERLEGRQYVIKAKRNWYEIWVPQDPDQWALPKIVFPDISPEPRFLFDNEGSIVGGNCYWIVLKDNVELDVLFLILAIANSRFMTNYHDIAFQNKLYAGRRRYLTQYVSKYPLPDPKSVYSARIISLAKQLVFERPSEEERRYIEEQIEFNILLAFKLTTLSNTGK